MKKLSRLLGPEHCHNAMETQLVIIHNAACRLGLGEYICCVKRTQIVLSAVSSECFVTNRVSRRSTIRYGYPWQEGPSGRRRIEIDHTLSRNNPITPVGQYHIDGLVQDCSNSIANTLELLQSCTKPSICLSMSWLLYTLYRVCSDSNPFGM